MKKNPHTSEISVFVDESGSFGPVDEFSRFYLLCMIDRENTIHTSSGQTFFEGERNFKKNFLRALRHKEWE